MQEPPHKPSQSLLSPQKEALLRLGPDFDPSPNPQLQVFDRDWDAFLVNCHRAYNRAVKGSHRTFPIQGRKLLSSAQDLTPPPLLPPTPVQRDLERAKVNLTRLRSCRPPNLMPALRTALRDLKDDSSIRICKADKGSSVTILDSADYVRRVDHLSDANTYTRLDSDPSLRIQAKLNYILLTAVRRGWIAEDIARACRRNPDKVKTQYIYFLLKVHKIPHQVRPIVSGRGGPTEFASALVDRLLQPYVSTCPQILVNNIQLINSLSDTSFTPNAILFTADIKSLYTNIPQMEGVHLVLRRIYASPSPPPTPKHLLRSLLLIILQDNVFIAQETRYYGNHT